MPPLQPRQFGGYTLAYTTEDLGERKPRHVIEATHPEAGAVAKLAWNGTSGVVHKIDVDSGHRRQGLATGMWDMAQDAPRKPKHSKDRTDAGNAWVASLRNR